MTSKGMPAVPSCQDIGDKQPLRHLKAQWKRTTLESPAHLLVSKGWSFNAYEHNVGQGMRQGRDANATHMPPTREVGVPPPSGRHKQAVQRTEAVTATRTSSQACVLSRRKCNTRRQQATESSPLHKHSTAPVYWGTSVKEVNQLLLPEHLLVLAVCRWCALLPAHRCSMLLPSGAVCSIQVLAPAARLVQHGQW